MLLRADAERERERKKNFSLRKRKMHNDYNVGNKRKDAITKILKYDLYIVNSSQRRRRDDRRRILCNFVRGRGGERGFEK